MYPTKLKIKKKQKKMNLRGQTRMSDPKELIDIYDENLTKIGVADRNEAHKNGAWHRAFHCWIVSGLDDGYVLFQKKGHNKTLFPDYLDVTAAGHYRAGETLSEGGIREVAEELGINIRIEDLVPLGIKFDIAKTSTILNHEFCDVFLYRKDTRASDYKPNTDEVEGLVEINIKEGLDLFSGLKKSATAKGIEWNNNDGIWRDVSMEVKTTSFVPRIDPYYYRIFIAARGLLKGDRFLSI